MTRGSVPQVLLTVPGGRGRRGGICHASGAKRAGALG